MLFQQMKRPIPAIAKPRFDDVKPGDAGYSEITYGKVRQIIDEDGKFWPTEAIRFDDALVWLFRTRNIGDPDEITRETLPEHLSKYPVALLPTAEKPMPTVTADELTNLARLLDEALRVEVHEASLYAEKWQGQGTAFGETFDMNEITAAHRTFPHNTIVKVTNVDNGKTVTVRINDRGPYVKGRDIDLSLAAFTTIAERSKGVIKVRLERLGDVSFVQPQPLPTEKQNTGVSCADPVLQRRVLRGIVFSPGIARTIFLGVPLAFSANKDFIVRSVTSPDGSRLDLQDAIAIGETYSFTPSFEGRYSFRFGTIDGKSRTLAVNAQKCDISQ